MATARLTTGAGLAIAVALAACSPTVNVPDDAQLTCSAPSECPSGRVCHGGLCVLAAGLDTTPPDYVSPPVVSPELGRSGTTFSIEFQTAEPLAEAPTVTLGLVPQVVLACDAAAENAYQCSYTATGAENDGHGGVVWFDVWMKDRGGNQTTRKAAGFFRLDFQAPAVAAASVAYVPGPSSPLAVLARATAGTTVHVTVSADELLGLAAPSLTVSFLGAAQAFEVVPGSLTGSGATFETVVPPGTPDGLYAASLTWTDEAGNSTTTSTGIPPVAVKTSAPFLTVDQGKVVFVRSPWGNSAAEPLGAYAIPAGTYFALEPADTLAASAGLDAGTFLLTEEAAPKAPHAVRVQRDPSASALVLGLLRPNADGTWPRQPLSSPDLATAYVVGIDDAGNESNPVKIRNAEYVATPNPPPMGESPNPLEQIGYASPVLVPELTVHSVDPLPAAGTDALAIVAAAEAAWTDRTPSATGPSLRELAAMAYDAGRGRVVLYGGGATGLSRDEDTWEWDGSRWTQVATSGGPGVRSAHAMAYDAARGRVVLFGGTDGNGFALGDTWEWDGSTWTRAATGGPGAREMHAMAFDGARRRVVLFGGDLRGTCYQDTWEWNGSAWTRVATTGPSARSGHGMAYDGQRGRVVLFGGYGSGSSSFGDTWEWDGSSWTRVATAGPGVRYMHAMAYDSARGRTVLAGGNTTTGSAHDTWEWNGSAWTQVATTGPAARGRHAIAYDVVRGRVVLFGGSNGGTYYRDTWEWNGTSWKQVAVAGVTARWQHGMAYDSGRGRVVLFGGSTAQDTWEWDGSTWTQAATTGPSARNTPGMAYDSARARTVLFGGRDTTGNLQDTWEWDGNAWTQVATTGPGARSEHAMVYDSARGRTVLFGGNSGTSTVAVHLQDTWEWDGSAWTQTATTGPAARREHAMAYDAARGRTVLFGGHDGSAIRSDAWEWNGTTWTQVTLRMPWPTPRFCHAMAYDSARGRVLVFGGITYAGDSQDFWEWDGSRWAQLTTAPSARYLHAMAYDAARRRAVVTGGTNSARALLGDTWERASGEPAIQFVASSGGIDPSAIAALRVRAFAGGELTAGGTPALGATLLGWRSRGESGEPGGWVSLAANVTGAAASAPYLPAAPASIVAWQSASADEARSALVERDGTLPFQVRAASTGAAATVARVALDYVEARVRYAVPADPAPTNLAYPVRRAVYEAGKPIAENVPSHGGGTATYYLISPPLPLGLSLDPSTGAISGTPAGPAPAATYTVTVLDASGGSTAATVTITVLDDARVPPASLVYPTNPASYPVAQWVENVPSSAGGFVESYSVAPALPDGLALSASTGVLSGTPTTPAPEASFVVTASNQGGSTTATLKITIPGCSPVQTFCGGGGLVCMADGTCGPCQIDADCPPPYMCIFDGTCGLF